MFKAIGDFFARLFTTNIGDMNIVDILLALFFIWLGYCIIKKVLSFFRGVKRVGYNVTHYSRVKCSRTQCPSCGRTLDKCVCASNQGKSYRKRLRSYKKTRKG